MTQKPKTTETNARKVFDVTRPGASKPNTSGRPLIVTDRPMVHDPMVMANEADAQTPKVSTETSQPPTAPELDPATPAPQPKGVRIEPSEAAVKEIAASKITDESPEAEPIAVTVAPKTTTPKSQAPTAPVVPESSQIPGIAKTVDTPKLSDDTQTTELKAEAPAPVETPIETTSTPDQPTENIIDQLLRDEEETEAKKIKEHKAASPVAPEFKPPQHYSSAPKSDYARPDETVPEQHFAQPIIDEHRHTKRLAVLFLVLLIVVAIVCLDVLLDSGAITLQGIPHTQFINTYQP